ncbi:MAG: N-acetyltransferase, partial [Caulobacteraceae bacterium]|nr:N-acetyltransferase [Caulobacteraceae bacterium]
MIRPVRTADHASVRALNLAAFGGAAEADLVERLRADGDVVFELVAEDQDGVFGHILFSRLWTDSEHLYAALAPMAVSPDRQRRGAGSDLVRSGLNLCKEFG